MIDEKLIDNVREHGTYSADWQGKAKVLADIGFPTGGKADYAIIMGCAQPEAIPKVIGSLKVLLDRLQISYTVLSKEFCCGWLPFGQPAVMAKNEEDIARSKELSREFVIGNFRQAEALGAKAIVLFCAACEPSYANLADETSLPVISYSALLERFFPGADWTCRWTTIPDAIASDAALLSTHWISSLPAAFWERSRGCR